MATFAAVLVSHKSAAVSLPIASRASGCAYTVLCEKCPLHDAGNVLIEACTNGPLNGWAVTNGYDALLRRTNLVTLYSGVPQTVATNNFDAASRIGTISDGTNSATYSFLANSPLVSQIVSQNNGATRMTTTKTYDYLNRLTQIASTPSASPVISFAYAYNNANQRTSVTNADGTYWLYGYDALGQVTSGVKYFNNGVPVPGEQFGYAFDNIGNRTSTTAGGDQNGGNLRTATYGANLNNQYTNRTVPGAVDILGSAVTNATVTVNNQHTYRNGTFYEATLALTNTSAAVWQSITNLAVAHGSATTDLVATVTGNTFLQQTPEAFSYDSDGNLIQDGRWTYTWDGENRLIQMVSLTNAPTGSKLRLTFGYDSKWRRISKAVEAFNGTTWTTNLAESFVYDGWNLLDKLNATNSAVIRSYMWGLDLSGSLQGAGGVGGLLVTSDFADAAGSHIVTFDAGGNVVGLVTDNSGISCASYEYNMFGGITLSISSGARGCSIEFSTKYRDSETELINYGYRYLESTTGSWTSRDPIGEDFSKNLYSFVKNDPIMLYDKLGMLDCPYQDVAVPLSELQKFSPTGLKDPSVVVKGACAMDWKQYFISSKPCACGFSFEYRSSCKARILYAIPMAETKKLKTASGNTVEDHEMEHSHHAVVGYSLSDDAWKSHAGKCLPVACYNATVKYLMAYQSAELSWISEQDAFIDFVDYPPGPDKDKRQQDWLNGMNDYLRLNSEANRLFHEYLTKCSLVGCSK